MKYTVFLGCIVAAIIAQSYAEFSEQDLELEQNGDQLHRLTRMIHHEPWEWPSKFARPSPRFPPTSPFQFRYARSAFNPKDTFGGERNYGRDAFGGDSWGRDFGRGTRGERYFGRGTSGKLDRHDGIDLSGALGSTDSRIGREGRFRRSAALNEQDIEEYQFDGDQFEQLTRSKRHAQWGPRPRSGSDGRLVQPFPTTPSFPKPPPSFPGEFPKIPGSFPNHRFRRSAALNEQDIEELHLDEDQHERLTRSLRPGPHQRPRPSPTFPRPPSNPGRYARSPSKIYDANMQAPKVIRNFGG